MLSRVVRVPSSSLSFQKFQTSLYGTTLANCKTPGALILHTGLIGAFPELILCVANTNTKNSLNPSQKKNLAELVTNCDFRRKFVSLGEPLGTVERDLQICDEHHKHKKLPRQHLPPSSHDLSKALFCHTLPSLWCPIQNQGAGAVSSPSSR